MTSPAKAKGSRFEREVVEYINTSLKKDAARRIPVYLFDKGDIHLGEKIIIQCKALKSISTTSVREALDASIKQKRNAARPHAIVCLKNSRHSVAESFVCIYLRDFIQTHRL
jgi:hypothetical protein